MQPGQAQMVILLFPGDNSGMTTRGTLTGKQNNR